MNAPEDLPPPEEMSDQELLVAIVQFGGNLVRLCQEQQAGVGKIRDDARWALSPMPLRFEAQLHVLFLGAVDAFDVVASLLRARASQQAFNMIKEVRLNT